MADAGCRIVTGWRRPDRNLVEQFRGLPAANIDDSMGRTGAVDSGIRPLGKGALLGTAFPVRVPPGDNLMVHAAMDLAEPGDVLVIDAGGFGDRAILGELMASYCRARGLAGVVCDGAVRDWAALASMEDFPVYSRAVTPNGPYKNGPGEIGVPVSVGGRVVHPGDIVIGDQDGLVIVEPAAAGELADRAGETKRKEGEILEGILREEVYPRGWMEEKLRELGCVREIY